jgi:hypothetical protein
MDRRRRRLCRCYSLLDGGQQLPAQLFDAFPCRYLGGFCSSNCVLCCLFCDSGSGFGGMSRLRFGLSRLPFHLGSLFCCLSASLGFLCTEA